MSNIKVMNEELKNKIAAGEIIEKSASVVKELVENSIDASSSIIDIDLTNGGTTNITVSDNGKGMDSKDAILCFERHATSKLKRVDDLYFIDTLGFRGEALPSIASVSKVTLKTCNNEIGTKIVIEGGKLILNEPSDSRLGTIITVKDLFYNTPARLKYLKSDTSELYSCINYIEKICLSHPEIKISLKNNEKTIISTSGSNDLLKVIYEIYGYEISSNMIPIKNSNDDFDIYGFISKPNIQKSTRNYINIIVNGRTIKNNELIKSICDTYHLFMPETKNPFLVLNINTDPTLIDVNIHPTKQDIKFSKIDSLKELLSFSIKESLQKNLLIPKINAFNNDFEINEKESFEDIKFDFSISENDILYEKQSVNEPIKNLELYPVGLLLGTYIACQNDEGIYLIDQHAAQERINYERVLHALESSNHTQINMLFPINIELSSSDFINLSSKIDILKNIGFDVSEFGINTFIFKAHPTWLKEGYEEESINRIVEIVINTDNNFDPIKFNDKVAATLACKMSIKANHSIGINEMESIINDLIKCDNPYNCPHGRPTIINFTKYELEKMFKRVMD